MAMLIIERALLTNFMDHRVATTLACDFAGASRLYSVKERAMGILDQVTGAMGGAQGGGVKAMLMQQLIAYLSKPGAFNSLMSGFQQQGLGNIMQSWLSTGQNLPIAPAQVQQVFGAGVLGGMAKKAGVGEQEAANHLSMLLPQVIDKISPDGKAPTGPDLSGVLASAGKLFG